MLRDGTVGLRAVHEAGGITIVQDPEGAAAAEMPRSAMKDLPVDYCLKLSDIGPVLDLLDLLVRRAGLDPENRPSAPSGERPASSLGAMPIQERPAFGWTMTGAILPTSAECRADSRGVRRSSRP
jgi:hypothetical protein